MSRPVLHLTLSEGTHRLCEHIGNRSVIGDNYFWFLEQFSGDQPLGHKRCFPASSGNVDFSPYEPP